MTCVRKSSSGEIVFRFMTFTLVLSLGSAKALSDQAQEIKRALSEEKKTATGEAPWMSRSGRLLYFFSNSVRGNVHILGLSMRHGHPRYNVLWPILSSLSILPKLYKVTVIKDISHV